MWCAASRGVSWRHRRWHARDIKLASQWRQPAWWRQITPWRHPARLSVALTLQIALYTLPTGSYPSYLLPPKRGGWVGEKQAVKPTASSGAVEHTSAPSRCERSELAEEKKESKTFLTRNYVSLLATCLVCSHVPVLLRLTFAHCELPITYIKGFLTEILIYRS